MGLYAPVLIVDDDMMNIEVVSAMLLEKNVRCDYAFNGTQALAMIKQRLELFYQSQAPMYRIILLDYSMP